MNNVHNRKKTIYFLNSGLTGENFTQEMIRPRLKIVRRKPVAVPKRDERDIENTNTNMS